MALLGPGVAWTWRCLEPEVTRGREDETVLFVFRNNPTVFLNPTRLKFRLKVTRRAWDTCSNSNALTQPPQRTRDCLGRTLETRPAVFSGSCFPNRVARVPSKMLVPFPAFLDPSYSAILGFRPADPRRRANPFVIYLSVDTAKENRT